MSNLLVQSTIQESLDQMETTALKETGEKVDQRDQKDIGD